MKPVLVAAEKTAHHGPAAGRRCCQHLARTRSWRLRRRPSAWRLRQLRGCAASMGPELIGPGFLNPGAGAGSTLAVGGSTATKKRQAATGKSPERQHWADRAAAAAPQRAAAAVTTGPRLVAVLPPNRPGRHDVLTDRTRYVSAALTFAHPLASVTSGVGRSHRLERARA